MQLFTWDPSLTPCTPVLFFWQCLERAHGDADRLKDAITKGLEQSDHHDDPTPSEACLVCSENLDHPVLFDCAPPCPLRLCARPVLFDCAHAVCFSCASGMLRANPNCMYAMSCPCAPVNRYTCRFAFLQTATDCNLLPDTSASLETVEKYSAIAHLLRTRCFALLVYICALVSVRQKIFHTL